MTLGLPLWLLVIFFLKRGAVFASGPWSALATVVFAYFVAILIHEMGHVIAAIATGMRVYFLSVGPLLVSWPPEGGMRFRWMWRTFFGGFTGCFSRDGRFPRREMAVVLAAGPFVSLLLACGTLALLYFGPSPSEWLEMVPWFPSVTFLLLGLGIFGAFGFMVTVLPLPTGNPLALTDGHQLLRVWQEAPGLGRWRAVRGIAYLNMAGIRPRDWPAPAIAALEPGTTRDSVAAIAAVLALSNAWDASRTLDAERHFSQAVELMDEVPPISRPGVRLSLALYEAWVRKNAAAARVWFKGASGPFVDAFHGKKVEAALHLLDGDARAALEAANEGVALLRKAAFPVTSMDREFFDEVRAAADALPASLTV
ncbi:MAG: M50 family metallopeptidase [Myxococcaceae bacterium]